MHDWKILAHFARLYFAFLWRYPRMEIGELLRSYDRFRECPDADRAAVLDRVEKTSSAFSRTMFLYRRQRCLRVCLAIMGTLAYFGVKSTIVFGIRFHKKDLTGHCWVVVEGKTIGHDQRARMFTQMHEYRSGEQTVGGTHGA